MLGYQSTNILLHVLFITTFLVVFFFTYASKVESNVVKIESKRIVSELVSDALLVLPDEAVVAINTDILPNLSVPDLQQEDADVKASNDALIKKTGIMLAVAFVVGIIIVFGMARLFGKTSNPPFTFGSIVAHNLIILAFVALTEFVFLYFFVQNYISIDSNYVKYRILETVDRRISTLNRS
jgi:hypothetical protein